MTQPIGGSLAGIMASGDEMVDQWVKHAQQHTASTPELTALMFMSAESWESKFATVVVLAASAIQRLAVLEGKKGLAL